MTRMMNAVTGAAGILTNSRDTLIHLYAFAARMGMPMPPAAEALLAPAWLPAGSGERPIPEPYFVVLSTIEPRKNHMMLLTVWRDLVRAYANDAPKLVLIGQRGWECENIVDLLDRCDALHEAVIECPRCDDRELATWLRHAQALLMPSFAEGYGMPVAEALMAGTPVIASNLPVFAEIAGEIPDYLDPLDGMGWRATILDYTSEQSPLRAAQRERLQSYRAPSWDSHFDSVNRLLGELQ
jgi:glycosyltransferase involved in cell wall biosynthesis